LWASIRIEATLEYVTTHAPSPVALSTTRAYTRTFAHVRAVGLLAKDANVLADANVEAQQQQEEHTLLLMYLLAAHLATECKRVAYRL